MGNHLKSDKCSFHGDELTLSDLFSDNTEQSLDQSKNRRQSERYELQLDIKLFGPNGSHSNKSRNISTGGMLLEQPVPEGFCGICEILIIHPETQERITFSAKLVGDLFNPNRLAFTQKPSAALKVLNKWILKHKELNSAA